LIEGNTVLLGKRAFVASIFGGAFAKRTGLPALSYFGFLMKQGNKK
jgi:hypothetical protein